MADPNTDLAVDLQEARSIQHVAEMHVALLSSGRWAVFYDFVPGPARIKIMPNLDEGWFRTVGEDAARKRYQAWDEYEARHLELVKVLSQQADEWYKTGKSLEDMGL